MTADAGLDHPDGSAFLLSAVGAEAAARFAARIASFGLSLHETGLLRVIAAVPGQSQQAIATTLGTPPSRLVGLLDRLSAHGLVERRRNPRDRRLHEVLLTEAGRAMLARIAAAGRAHDDETCEGLGRDERDQLRVLLLRIAERRGLTPGVHPGYRDDQPASENTSTAISAKLMK